MTQRDSRYHTTFRRDQTRELGAARQRARRLGLRVETQADEESLASATSGGRILIVYGPADAIESFRVWVEGGQ